MSPLASAARIRATTSRSSSTVSWGGTAHEPTGTPRAWSAATGSNPRQRCCLSYLHYLVCSFVSYADISKHGLLKSNVNEKKLNTHFRGGWPPFLISVDSGGTLIPLINFGKYLIVCHVGLPCWPLMQTANSLKSKRCSLAAVPSCWTDEPKQLTFSNLDRRILPLLLIFKRECRRRVLTSVINTGAVVLSWSELDAVDDDASQHHSTSL